MRKPPRNPERILVVLLAPIGDTLFATPVLHALREAYPSAHVAVLLFPSNRGILDGNPDVDELIVYPTLQHWYGWRYFFGLYWRLRVSRFDLSVDISTFTFWLTRVVAGIPRRVRLRFPNWWWLLPGRDPRWATTHSVYHYLNILKPLGLSVENPRLWLNIDDDDRRFAAEFLAQHGLAKDDTLVALHPGAEGFYGRKRWYKERFAAVADELVRRHGVKIVLLGGAEDMDLAAEVAGLMTEEPINAAGCTTLKQTAAIMERSELFVGNDSSPLHIASAMGTPVVGIYGPSNHQNYYPFGVRASVVRPDLPCQPCFYLVGALPLWRVSRCKEPRCLEAISVEQVLAAAELLLASEQSRKGTTAKT